MTARRALWASSRLRVPKNDSAAALSQHTPVAPIDWITPSSVQRSPNSAEVYCLGSRGGRNTVVSGGE